MEGDGIKYNGWGYLMDKIVPGVLKVGPEEDAGPTLVGGVHGGPPEADQEHGPTLLHLLRPRPEEPCQVSPELPLVRLCRRLTRAVDEHPPSVVGRRSPLRHALRNLCSATLALPFS